MLARYSTAMGFGTVTTIALLYVMQLLISLQPGAESDTPPRVPFVWGTTVPETPAPLQHSPEIDKEKLTNSNATPPRQHTGKNGVGIYLPPEYTPPRPGQLPGPELSLQDGPLVEVMLVQPDYPIGAQRQGLEGYVIVEFDVLPSGRVTNVSVVESSHRIFERAAISAAQGFRFKARVIDGVPLASTGIRKLFRFDMSE